MERARSQVRGRETALPRRTESGRYGHPERHWRTTPAAAERYGSRIGKTDRAAVRSGANPYADRLDGYAETLRYRIYRQHRHSDTVVEGRSHLREQSEDTPDDDTAGTAVRRATVRDRVLRSLKRFTLIK